MFPSCFDLVRHGIQEIRDTQIISQETDISFFRKGVPVVFEYVINKTYKTSLDTTLLIIHRQRHVSAA